MSRHDLVVHLGAAPSAADRPPSDGSHHVRVRLWPRPGPLPGADLVVAHGVPALVAGVARARRHRVPVRYRPTGLGLDATLARLFGIEVDLAAPSEVAQVPTPEEPAELRLADGLRLVPSATRRSGVNLLVADPNPDHPPMELTGTGPQIWHELHSGTTLGEVVRRLVAVSGGPPDEVEESVLRFARSLIDAGLAERR